MQVRKIQSKEDLERYAVWVQACDTGNFWQSLERKRYIEALGKKHAHIYVTEQQGEIIASALVVVDRTVCGYCTWEIARGPIVVESVKLKVESGLLALMDVIVGDAKKDKCIALYYSPMQSNLILNSQLSTLNSQRSIHCQATRIIDLTLSEEEILAQMKPKGRYNINVAKKRGIVVQESDDIDAFYHLVQQTGKRDGFTHLPKAKYQAFLDHIPNSFLLLAYSSPTPDALTHNPTPIAGVLSTIWEKRGIYYYGASNYAERATMAPYLLQWESMRYCKAQGCKEYDLLGVAPPNVTEDHPWLGITAFKEKFGGVVVTYPQEQMIILKPVIYQLLHIKRLLM